MDSDISQNQGLPPPYYPEHKENRFSKFQCSKCKIGFLYLHDLKLHLSDREEVKISCSKCEKSYTTERALNQHYGKVHCKKRPAKCSICKKKFRTKYAVKFHKMQVHEKSTRETCPNCDKKFFNGYSLQRHIDVCKGDLIEDSD